MRNKNTRNGCDIFTFSWCFYCYFEQINVSWVVVIAHFEHMQYNNVMFLLLTLNLQLPKWWIATCEKVFGSVFMWHFEWVRSNRPSTSPIEAVFSCQKINESSVKILCIKHTIWALVELISVRHSLLMILAPKSCYVIFQEKTISLYSFLKN